ncbi:hypothetical protein G9A89_012627 [Geosiphon pyriformis]|nr:hypothetical protein G9A89_012627 [Geosiphon pyriformis]
MADYINLAYCGKTNNEVGVVVKGGNVFADVHYSRSKEGKLYIISFFKGPDYIRDRQNVSSIKITPYEIEYPKKTVTYVRSTWLEHVRQMMPVLLDKIKRVLIAEQKSIKDSPMYFFTGHGIGGAYALLAALEYQKLSPTQKIKLHGSTFLIKEWPINVVTFGTPRVGNEIFADSVNKAFYAGDYIYRVTHSNDWVPRSLSKENFVHHERELWITKPDDCDCRKINRLHQSYTADKNYAVYECPGFRVGSDYGENLNCNVGTLDGEGDVAAHYGPYFGITIGDCKPMITEQFNLPRKNVRGLVTQN